MEPLSTAAIAIGTVVATKALEKTGEKVGEALWNKTGKFLVTLKKHAPNTITAIEKAPEQPLDYAEAVVAIESAAQLDIGVNQAMHELVAAAKVDPKVAPIVQKLENNINFQSASVINNTKLAESIKNVFQGNTIIGGTF
jgi:hypothetical protein